MGRNNDSSPITAYTFWKKTREIISFVKLTQQNRDMGQMEMSALKSGKCTK